MNNYYMILIEEKKKIEEKIVDFFQSNPKPKDVKLFLEETGIEEKDFNNIVYSIMSSFFGEGDSNKSNNDFDPNQLKMGLKEEMEHTTNKFIAEKISKDHLSKNRYYYTCLKKMEA